MMISNGNVGYTAHMKGKELERQFKAVANKRRIAILTLLKRRDSVKVGVIADEIKLSFNATSKHIGVLYAAGFVDREQFSLEMHYRIADKLSADAKAILAIL